MSFFVPLCIQSSYAPLVIELLNPNPACGIKYLHTVQPVVLVEVGVERPPGGIEENNDAATSVEVVASDASQPARFIALLNDLWSAGYRDCILFSNQARCH